MKFVKMHGIGNDYVYINGFETKIENPEKLAIKVSDRHKGIGSDGLVLILPSEKADVRMRMFNNDGSEAEMCGNAIRCVGKFAYENKLVNSETFTCETLAGNKVLTMHLKDGKVHSATVDMGIPYWNCKDIPVALDEEYCFDYPIEIEGKVYKVNCVSVGNPHAIVFMDTLDDVENLEIEKIGPKLECHPLFPRKINVEFVKVIDKTKVRMRVWERGSGETEACGTGACATALVCAKLGYTDNKVEVVLNGGSLFIDWREDDHFFMTGEAQLVFEGNYYED